jgi:formamidopyrimidine-DNA glycosylase
MPELPEVETTLRAVAPWLVGRRIQELIVRDHRLRWPVPPSIHTVEGHTVHAARRRGKYLLFDTPAGTLLLHLGMSGSLRIADPTSPWRRHDHVAITLESSKQLRLHDPRRFGAVLLVQAPGQHPLLHTLGPEPLGPDFTAAYLHAVTRGKRAPAKQVVMDSRIVAGVGNIYACESLFRARIRPTRQARRLTLADCTRLVAAVRRVLRAAIERGGTTLRDFVHGTGEPGYFKQQLSVYDRSGLPCRRCQTAVRSIRLGQRSTFFCPHCQPG